VILPVKTLGTSEITEMLSSAPETDYAEYILYFLTCALKTSIFYALPFQTESSLVN